MIVTKHEKLIFCDVDDTLVLPVTSKKQKKVQVVDPVERRLITMRIHEPMVRLVKEEFQRGSYIVVWSRGGWEWAANVVRALGLEQYVHEVKSKPITYFDDKPVKEWLKDRVYLAPDMEYKK